MKNLLSLSLFLLFAFSVKAQSHKSNLIKTVVAINTILYQSQQAQFVNQEGNIYYLKKINATLSGDVFSIDSSPDDDEKSKQKIFNLLELHSFVRKGNEINVVYKNDKKNDVISNVRVQDIYALRKELSALQVICTQYSEQDPRFKCD